MVSADDVKLLVLADDPNEIGDIIEHWRRRQLETYRPTG